MLFSSCSHFYITKKIPGKFSEFSYCSLHVCFCSLIFFIFFFHSCHTYSSLIPVDYGNETDDDDQNENDDTNKTNAENVATNSLQQNNEFEKNAEKIEPIEMVPAVLNNNVDEQIATNEIIQTIATVAPSTESHSEISIDSSGCDLNNGGCEQTCTMVPDEEIGTNVVECSCRAGFYLDSDEGKKCLGECMCLSFLLDSNSQ